MYQLKCEKNVIQLTLRLLSVELRLPDELWRKHVLKNKEMIKETPSFVNLVRVSVGKLSRNSEQ